MSKNFDSPIEIGFCGSTPETSFDPSKVKRLHPECGIDCTICANPHLIELGEGKYVNESDYDALSLRYTNLQHFMRRMAELHGFEMEETK